MEAQARQIEAMLDGRFSGEVTIVLNSARACACRPRCRCGGCRSGGRTTAEYRRSIHHVYGKDRIACAICACSTDQEAAWAGH